jgi:hypothetical protein
MTSIFKKITTQIKKLIPSLIQRERDNRSGKISNNSQNFTGWSDKINSEYGNVNNNTTKISKNLRPIEGDIICQINQKTQGLKLKRDLKSSSATQNTVVPLKRKAIPKVRTIDLSIQEVKSRMDEIARNLSLVSWENAPEHLDADDQRTIEERFLAAEALIDSGSVRDDGALELVIGFDLGSTSTKIVINFPYAEALGAFAVPAPTTLRAEDSGPHPYYWHTRLWKSTENQYSLLPSDKCSEISGMKVDFLNAGVSIDGPTYTPVAADINISAYVALMVRQALGWLSRELGPTLTKDGIRVSSNIGFPAEPHSKKDELFRFQACFNVGLELALSKRKVDDATILECFGSAPKGRGVVVPEFIGAVMGYFSSTRKRSGTYFLCDFGGLTCDCVFFGFTEDGSGTRVFRIYGAQVKNYGAEVAIRLLNQGVSKYSFQRAIGTLLSSTLSEAYGRIGQSAMVWGGRTPLFWIGGGKHLSEYKGVFKEAESLIENAHFKTNFDQQEIDLPERLNVREANGRSCDRLILAWGLSHPDLDLPEWVTSAQIPLAPSPRRAKEKSFIGPEQI